MKIFFLILAVAAVLLAFLYPRFGFETFTWAGTDAAQYNLLAENMLRGRGFSLHEEEPFVPSPARMPGYPLYLAASKLVSGGILLAVILQIIAHAFLAVLVYKLGRRFLSEKLSVAGAVLTGFNPYFLFMSISLMTETLFTLSLLGSLYFIIQYFDNRSLKAVILSALLLGVSALLRPTTQMLPIAWLAVVVFDGIWRREFLRVNIKAVAAFIFVFLFVLFPWALRNKIQFDRWSLVSANGYGYYVATPVQIIALRDGISRSEARIRLMADFENAFRGELARDARYPDSLAFDKFHYSDWFAEQNSRIVSENFKVFTKAVLIAVPEFLTKNDWLHPFEKYDIVRPEIQPTRPLYRYWSEEGIPSAAREVFHRFSCGTTCILSFGLVAFGRIFYLLVALFTVLGSFIVIRDKKNRIYGLLMLVLILYFAAAHLILTASAGHERYRLPAVPIMVILALSGLSWIIHTRKNGTTGD